MTNGLVPLIGCDMGAAQLSRLVTDGNCNALRLDRNTLTTKLDAVGTQVKAFLMVDHRGHGSQIEWLGVSYYSIGGRGGQRQTGSCTSCLCLGVTSWSN